MKKFFTNRRFVRFSLVLLLLVLSASFLQAQVVWRGTTSNKWSVSSNWSPARVPTASDDVVIGSATITNQPTVDVAAVCKSLTIGGTYASTLTVNYGLSVSGNVVINTNGTLTHAASQTLTVTGNWTCSGNYLGQYSSAVVFAGGTQTISGSNVDFKNLTVNKGSTALLSANVTADVSVLINGTWDPNEGTGTYQLNGSTSATIGSTGIVKVKAATATSNFQFTGPITINPGGTIDYASTLVTQTIYSSFAYDNLKISGSGVKQLSGDYASWNTSGVDVGNITVMPGCTLDLYSYSLSRGNTGGTLTVNNGATLRIGGTNSLPVFMNYSFGTTSTVEYYGSLQTITPGTYGNLMISGTGTKTAGGAMTINDFTLSTSTFVGGSYTHKITGDWTMNSGTFTNSGTTIQFTGTGAQSITSSGAFSALNMNKASGTTKMLSDVTVASLSFTKGNITTMSNTLIVPSGGSVTGAGQTTGWVDGRLQRYVSTTTPIFNIGNKNFYAPVSLTLASLSTAGNLVVSCKEISHPNISTSTINKKNISAYWTITMPGGAVSFTTMSAQFVWDVSANYSPVDPTALKAALYIGSTWSYPTVSGTSTATSLAVSGLTQTSLGDFTMGETCTAVPNFSYTGTPYCLSGTATPTFNSGGSAGTFTSSPTGPTLNGTTGVVTLSSSTAGTYTITNTVGTGACATSSTASIVINPTPPVVTPVFSLGSSSTRCIGGATVTYTASANYSTGISYSLDATSLLANVKINAATGAVTYPAGWSGTSVITATATGCNGPATASHTVTTNDVVATPVFSLGTSSTRCAGAGTVSYTAKASNASGITYSLDANSLTAGNTIDATTGTVTYVASWSGKSTITASAAGCNGPKTANHTVTMTVPPSATITYAGSPFCTSVGSGQHVTQTGTGGGSYSASPAGLTLNVGNGDIVPASSVPGTYTVTYTVAASGGCGVYTTTTTVTIVPMPSAVITYAGSPFCSTASTPQLVTLTGTSGGSFSSAAGLSINATTGAITPSASTPGNYTVTYTVAAAGGCSAFSTTASITITTPPSATISYAGPFCSSAGGQHVTRTGTTGGTYSVSPAGLTLNTGNGDITPSSSIPGTYTVSYTVAASGGCSAYTATTTVTVTALPSATIAYSGTPFCSSVNTPQTVTLVGTSGGVYSSTAGLAIDPTTGAITPSASTPGNYTVKYTVAAANGCAAYSTTTNVTISVAPSATIGYGGSSFCKSLGGAIHVIQTGTGGGVYTASPAGLALNAGNGDMTPSNSTPGTYTVTYTIAASGGCSTYTTSATVTVTATPSATISYSGAAFCASVSTAQTVTRTGTSGGTYSASPTGLTIDATTGNIIPSSSVAGTYTVTYTVAASGGCAAFSTTAPVTITPAPSATIAYAGSPFTTAGGTISVIRTGTSGGTYSSTAGLSINTASGDINLGASTSGNYTITYTVAASGGCAAYTATTSLTVYEPYLKWTGATNTDWKTSSNWSPAKVPDDKADVVIPAGLSVYPVIPGSVADAKAEDLTIASGASLKLYGTLTLTGSIYSNGGIVADSLGTIVMHGVIPQTISANAFTSEISNLTIDNKAGVTLLGKVKLNDALTLKNGALTSNGNLILRSTALRTARVAPITSTVATPVIGDVTVERYVAGRRKYRLITSAVTTSTATTLTAGQESRSIWGNWQNSGNNTTPGIGTFITGGTAAAGYDVQTSSSSLYTYNDVTKKFVAFSSANGKNTKYTPLVAGVGYYMFVYGDRTNSLATPNPNNTTLSETGTLLTGDQLYTTTTPIRLADSVGKYTLLGNPFASPINWMSVTKNNVDNICWGWDPNLGSTGGYVTVNATLSGITLISPVSTKVKLDQYIQSGQAFFVRTTGRNPTITIQENDKVTNVNNLAFKTAGVPNSVPLLAVNLLYNSAGSDVFADGALAVFDNSFADTLGKEDALKIAGSAEAVSIENTGQLLSIDARSKKMNIDTLNLNLAKLTRSQYTLEIFAKQMAGGNVQAYLNDRYLKTSKLLSLTDTNSVSIGVDPAVSASVDPRRFYISLVNLSSLPVKFTSVTAAQEGKNVKVQWTVTEETAIRNYKVEKSTDGLRFLTAGEVKARGQSGTQQYSLVDEAPLKGDNFYRVTGVGTAGAETVSKVVNVKIIGGAANILVSPNPVKDQQINLQVSGIDKGVYSVSLYNPEGREVWRTKIDYTGGLLYQLLQPPSKLSRGLYYLLIANDRNKFPVRILVE